MIAFIGFLTGSVTVTLAIVIYILILVTKGEINKRKNKK